MSKIIKLTSENVKRISVVQITPEGNLVVIGGKNGQGKSSVLDSIEYALAGGDSLPAKPVRKGEDKAKVELDLGDLIVKRTFTAGGGTSLVVTNKDGVRFASPQAMLDGLTGKLSFDPLDFAQQKPDQQSETLRSMVGLDVSKEDAEIEKLFNERTALNRDVKALQSRLVAAPEHSGITGEEVSTASIIEAQKEAATQNAANESERNKLKSAEAALENSKIKCADQLRRISSLEAQLTEARDAHATVCGEWEIKKGYAETQRTKVQGLIDNDLSPFQERAARYEQENRQRRENKTKADIRSQFNAKQKQSDTLTAQLDALEKKKRTAIQNAKFPVAGLGLDDRRQVTFNGLPLEQASTAEQLRVSVAIGLALNKNLRILLIRRGSDLDPDSLKLVAEMATQADAQVWLETSRTDAPISVVMEDGHIAEAQP